MKIDEEKLSTIIDSIEDFSRRKIADYDSKSDISYIDNSDYNLRKMKKSNNNIIEARRGCGKTTLMLKSIFENPNCICITQDCQILKDYSYSKIIIGLLTTINNGIINELSKQLTELKKEKKFFVFYKKNKEIKAIKSLIEKSNSIGQKFYDINKLPDELVFEYANSTSNESKNDLNMETSARLNMNSSLELQYSQDFTKLNSKLNASIDFIAKQNLEEKEAKSTQLKYVGSQKITKNDLLEDLKLLFIVFIKMAYEKTNKGMYLYLDDFYMINKNLHPTILKYFHDLYKVTKKGVFCFKIVTLPSSLQLNLGRDKTFSVKDDYSLIQLDYDLSNLDQIQAHLFEIIKSLSKTDISKSEFESLFSDDKTLKELIIATGGIPRDFMKAFGEAVRIANRNSHNTIYKKDIYEVVKNLKEDKDRNIEIDSELSPESIEIAINELIDSLENKFKTNVILYPIDLAEKHEHLLKNLVNLRYLHLIKDKVSSRNKKNYRAYLIDMTFYATGNMSKNIEFCEFWERDEHRNLDNLRKSPEWNFSEKTIKEIEKIESEHKA